MTVDTATPASPMQAHCQTCRLNSLCLPLALGLDALDDFDAIIRRRAPLKRGEALFDATTPFTHLFAVRCGSLKQSVTQAHGEERITHFYLPGELVGLDGLASGGHPGLIQALETTAVCAIPFAQLDRLSGELPELRHALYRSMSRELHDDRYWLCRLAGHTAEARLASFIIDLSHRFQRCGLSPTRFRLPMARADIGSHLGLAVETISRLMGRFQQAGLLRAARREITLLEYARLAAVARGETPLHE
ncbi:CRP/FNR family transcriptional regulator [Chromohalobacter marismortui]|uniref:CRP/FNR family transcriptional regulator n=1 Tax=Chromohalobacter marismortui TaxID=42055 RepID=A0A4V3F427_9GAMM|nr:MULTISPECIES: fumarate/nitrate reduction transcriptional regulator Fnr [Chromohalobacter]MCI0509361.1 fumarate/nitrate reduction transcriptional regulator Fnr [Chromohalobacter sp.]MCI0594210.1 fumarate/nitrate reduction transcriptional regulator Fnr [Chromohalobacter sp.]TDU23746.1 CRP/FNR family transcriptional regulator [Chromohalobacter marismortui]